MKRICLLGFLILFNAIVFGVFTDVNLPIQGVFWGESDWGDYDNDGDLDILISGFISNDNYITRIYRNDGSDNFTDINAGLTDVQWSSVAWGDYDNDGDLDFILTGITSGTNYISKIYRNDGSDTFTDINAGLPGLMDGDCAWADYDNDGDLDFVLSGTLYGGTHLNNLYRNDGSGVFTNANAGFPLIRHTSFNWGDFDNDNDLDLLMTGYFSDSNYTTRLYRNNGDGSFTDVNAGFTGTVNGCVRWGDYDNDGYLDILLMGQHVYIPQSSITKIYRNNGNSTFTDINAAIIDASAGSAEWGDFDNDGDLDIAIMGYAYSEGAGISKIYQNDGSGVFSLFSNLIPISGGNIVWGDYDNDGDLDALLTGNIGFAAIKLYRNETVSTNSVPSAPTGLSAAADTVYVTFSWNPSSDVQTPTAALNYVLRIGTVSGAFDIVSPMSSNNGYRKVPAIGAATSVCTWKVKSSRFTGQNNYYWSVQAVDGALAGSSFATEAVFSNITVTAPDGGETFPAGSWADITWNASENVDEVNILFTSDGGSNWNVVNPTPLPASLGIYSAECPYLISGLCRVAVVSTTNSAFNDQSDSFFSIISNPPLPPQNVVINMTDSSVVLNWDTVTQTVYGTDFTPDYYLVFFNGSDDIDGTYYYLGRSYTTSIVHDGVVLHADNMFYRVRAFKQNWRNNPALDFPELNRYMTEEEVYLLLD